MSFQQFRIQGPPLGHPPQQQHYVTSDSLPYQAPMQHAEPNPPAPPPHLQGPSFQVQLDPSAVAVNGGGPVKAPYGSGDSDDGYTLVFDSMDDFQAWRLQVEEQDMVEFVKGDMHGSKAVPPRFKDHTKLVCARHSRSGRKKYIKKHPERQRKVPSRKLEGEGCHASISYKTYFGTDMVRAMYISTHSHEIGPANLPFTKRGRKGFQVDTQMTGGASGSGMGMGNGHGHGMGKETISPASGSSISGGESLTTSPQMQSLSPTMQHHQQQLQQQLEQQKDPVQAQQQQQQHHPVPTPLSTHHSPMIPAASPPGTAAHAIESPYDLTHQQQPPPPQGFSPVHNIVQDRWDRMGVLFENVRDQARSFEFPNASVVALESVLIRLYLESPVNQVQQGGATEEMMGHHMI